MTRRQKIGAYVAIARLHLRAQLAYRADFVFRMLGLLVQVYLLALVWRAVYPGSGTVAAHGGHQVGLATQLAYATYAAVQNWLLNPGGLAPTPIPQRVREGSVAFDLARPVAFPAQMLTAQAGTVLAGVPFAALALPFAIVVGGARAPASPGAALAYALSLVPALLNALLLAVIVSMVCFWTLEVVGIFVIHRVAAQFFAGALVPLWFMPAWLADLAQVLPFQTTTYTPIALYLGHIHGAGPVLTALAVQFGWTAALWLITRAVWARALHRVVVQGG
ncbi:ABC transporter permease [Streptomyces litchfieldiae]|uniref:ABC-2 family transporter protein n=1 Tax=Streptomyces litchfieldiae TaxID=3075543 RepID=A0ABU2MRY0_9ACTN|nr:ABC-2 family transporter protein [Streptomyces sp. DSM 44938]MDT0344392.1 ABC-2 family transporter protein [Streptomyces sp. DSM 44938]